MHECRCSRYAKARWGPYLTCDADVRLNSVLLGGQKREAKACLEAAGKLWENMHSNQSYARKKEDDVYKVAFPLLRSFALCRKTCSVALWQLSTCTLGCKSSSFSQKTCNLVSRSKTPYKLP